MAKVALRFGCAKQSKNIKRYLVSRDYVMIWQYGLEFVVRSSEARIILLLKKPIMGAYVTSM